MLRFTGCAIVVLYALTAIASAEKISFRPSGALETALDWSDPLVQQAVMAAAPMDWYDTPGADVWWVTLQGQRIQVQVFPALERPGNGQPGCCVHFVVRDSEFWLKVKAVSPPSRPGQVEADQNISHPSGKDGVVDVVDEAMASDLGPPGDPFNSSDSAGGDSADAERLESDGASTQPQLLATQVPEPGLLVLMGLGAAAALGRGRTRGRTIP